MRSPSFTALVENDVRKGPEKSWLNSVTGADGCVYGVPSRVRNVVKFNPIDKSLTTIGQDLGDGTGEWTRGVLANTIYCASANDSAQILKIDTTINDTTTV